MEDYGLILLATLLLAADFAFCKLYQAKLGTAAKTGLLFNMTNGLITAIIFWALNGFHFSWTPFSVIVAFVMSALAVTYSVIGFRVLKMGSMSLYTVFLMTGGMVLPYIYGLIFLDERFSIWRMLGLIVIFGAVILANGSKKKTSGTLIALCVCVFVLNGVISILSKTHQITELPVVNAKEYVMLTGLAKFVLCPIAYLFFRKEETAVTPKRFAGALPIIALSALVSGSSYLLQLYGAVDLPATVLYPCVTGGSIIFSSLAGVIFFREKLSVKQIIAVALCFGGTCLFL